MKAMQVNVSFILFLWTIYVCRDLKQSLQGNDQFKELRQQINRFFTIVLVILAIRTLIQLAVFVLWSLEKTSMLEWSYLTSWKFIIWWAYAESSSEGFLNYFLIYHLFKNASVQ